MHEIKEIKEFHIHYAKINLIGDIPCFDFWAWTDVVGFCLAEADVGAIYLYSIFDEVFITPRIASAIQFIQSQIELHGDSITGDSVEIFVQEYTSIEEAYRVGLTMFDGIEPRCYEN